MCDKNIDLVKPLTICEINLETLNFPPTSLEIARIFCEFSDDEQAAFFVYVGKIMEQWRKKNACSQDFQLIAIGGHLRDCEGAEAGRYVIDTIQSEWAKCREVLT